jgi:hypothetical protein
VTTIRNPQSAIHHGEEPTLRERFQELNLTSSREAEALAVQGKSASVWAFLFCPFGAFLQVYFRNGNWRYGIAGLVTALFAAYGVFARYAKLWEHHHNNTRLFPPSSPS